MGRTAGIIDRRGPDDVQLGDERRPHSPKAENVVRRNLAAVGRLPVQPGAGETIGRCLPYSGALELKEAAEVSRRQTVAHKSDERPVGQCRDNNNMGGRQSPGEVGAPRPGHPVLACTGLHLMNARKTVLLALF